MLCRTSRENRATTASSARAERRRRGITCNQHHVFDVAPELIGDHLGDRCLQAVAVATCSHLDAHFASGIEPNRRVLCRTCTEPQGGRLDVEAETHAEVA